MDHEEIEKAAYYKWLEAGCPEGDGVDFWLEAEREQKFNNTQAQASRWFFQVYGALSS